MSEFNGFSDAARLYAAKLNVINAMKELLEQDVSSYVDALGKSIALCLDPARLSDQTASGYRRWRIGEDGDVSDKRSRVWFLAKPAEVLTEKRLNVHVYAANPAPAKLSMLKQIPELHEFTYCRLRKDRWSFVDAEIKCDESDLFDGPSQQIAALLRELHRIDCECHDQP